jgi:mono/diheme cytochrome c family protein
VPRAAHLFGARDGGIWIADGVRLAGHAVEPHAADPRWRADVEPVFQRVCAHCHLPGGSADLDLSTQAAWTAERGEIVRRVLVTRTMPPAGTELGETDRAALARWLRTD